MIFREKKTGENKNKKKTKKYENTKIDKKNNKKDKKDVFWTKKKVNLKKASISTEWRRIRRHREVNLVLMILHPEEGQVRPIRIGAVFINCLAML